VQAHAFDCLDRLLDVRRLYRRHILKDIKLEFCRARADNLRGLVTTVLSGLRLWALDLARVGL
jgi:hypothetical protein